MSIEIVGENNKKPSTVSAECSVKVNLEPETTRVCRICYLKSKELPNQCSGFLIELGCSCKDDLSNAHERCAETWFKIKGNKKCEICGSIAKNVGKKVVMPRPPAPAPPRATAQAPALPEQPQHFWQGQHFREFVLAVLMFAVVYAVGRLIHHFIPY